MKIDSSLVQHLLCIQFPHWAELPVSAVEPNGWDNRTFRLGETLSVRLPSAARYSAQVEKEHNWLPELAPHLPLPIPVPLAMGVPCELYPWHWSIYRWIEGENSEPGRIADMSEFAVTLAQFLLVLQAINPSGGPAPGPHNFFRGGPLSVYNSETRQAIASLDGKIDSEAVSRLWEAALEASWQGPPVWLHGDVSSGNLLIKNGRLHAVIDFGSSGIGDPACDLVIAWTLFSGKSRKAFRETLSLDSGCWLRARGWVLWKALITLAEHVAGNPLQAERALCLIQEVLGEPIV